MSYPLLTERLAIEPLAHRDLPPFVRYRQDAQIARFQSWDTDYSEDQGRSLIDSQVGILIPKPGEWLQLGIHETENGELIGDLAVHRLENDENSFEIGFTLAPTDETSDRSTYFYHWDSTWSQPRVGQNSSRTKTLLWITTKLGS
jgi:RimJ/RimL family protein N-acetyltransferase